jgi:hypothetical protein
LAPVQAIAPPITDRQTEYACVDERGKGEPEDSRRPDAEDPHMLADLIGEIHGLIGSKAVSEQSCQGGYNIG